MATKRIKIPCKSIQDALKQGNEISVKIANGLPDDAYITDVRFDQYNRVIEIDVQGSFESRGYADFAIVAEDLEKKPKAKK